MFWKRKRKPEPATGRTYVYRCYSDAALQLTNWALARKYPFTMRNWGGYTEVTLTVPLGKPELREDRGGIVAEWGVGYPWGSVPPVYYSAEVPDVVSQQLETWLKNSREAWRV